MSVGSYNKWEESGIVLADGSIVCFMDGVRLRLNMDGSMTVTDASGQQTYGTLGGMNGIHGIQIPWKTNTSTGSFSKIPPYNPPPRPFPLPPPPPPPPPPIINFPQPTATENYSYLTPPANLEEIFTATGESLDATNFPLYITHLPVLPAPAPTVIPNLLIPKYTPDGCEWFLDDVSIGWGNGYNHININNAVGLTGQTLDVTHSTARLRISLFADMTASYETDPANSNRIISETKQINIMLYPRNVMLKAVEPVVIDPDTGNFTPNAYVSVVPHTVEYIYVVNIEEDATSASTGIDILFDVTVNDVGIANRSLKFIFEDSKGITFSQIIHGMTLWFPLSTKRFNPFLNYVEGGASHYQNFDDPNNGRIYSNFGDITYNDTYGNTNGTSGWGQSLFSNMGTSLDVGLDNYTTVTTNAIGGPQFKYIHAYSFVFTSQSYDEARVPEGGGPTGQVKPHVRLIPFDDNASDLQVSLDPWYCALVEKVPNSAKPTPITVAYATSLLNAPLAATDISYLPNTFTTNSVWAGISGQRLYTSIPVTYGQDFCFYIALAAQSFVNADAALDLSKIDFLTNDATVTIAGAYYSGATTNTLVGGDIKVWRFNVSFDETLAGKLTAGEGALTPIVPFERVAFSDQFDKAYTSPFLPVMTFAQSANPLEFVWNHLTPDGLKTPFVNHVFGNVTANSGRANTVTKAINLRSTFPASEYVITGVQISQTTAMPASLTASSRTAIAGDFLITGDITQVSNTTTAPVTAVPTKTSLASLEEFNLNVVFGPSLKILNTITMTNPATLVPATLIAVNTRKLKIQVMGYKVGGSTTPIMLGTPFILSGTVV